MPSESPRILLTGAGFTHNFGTPSAEEMWSHIFNHPEVQRHTRIRNLLLKDFDFESVYGHVTYGDYPEPEKVAIEHAVRCAFDGIDRNIMTVPQGLSGDISFVDELLARFAAHHWNGFFFTLNQDLFVERWYKQQSRKAFRLAGLPDRFARFHPEKELSDSDYCQLPTSQELEEHKRASLEGGFSLYVKLHGSHNWVDSSGKQKMVIGGRKAQQIQQEPLLRWYWELFHDVLQRPGARMLVIGYGFRDEHVNSALGVGVEHGLRMWVVSPKGARDFVIDLRGAHDGETIMRGLSGYFPCALRDMSPPLAGDTQALRSLYECVFGNR